MAFSLFGKKPTVPAPTTKAPTKPSARAEDKPAPASDEELISLDFTQPGETPRAGAGETIQVNEVAQQVPPVIEQAAMLFAAEQAAPACESLRAAVHHNDFGRYAQRAWGMLFDLYQELGRQADFDALALEYAARFESSPPAWRAGHAERRKPAAAASRSGVAVAGVLGAKSQDAMQQLLKYAEKNASVRLDLVKVTDADEQGCALLNATLRQLKKAGKECVLAGADKLASVLAKKVAMGTREREHTWLLLLALYQQMGAQDAFDDAAVNYAVTFEVSPPSWEAPPATTVKPGKDAASAVATVAEEDDECALEGDIVGTDETPFAPIRLRAEQTDDVVVDVSRLHRMDFIAAANLMNVVSGLVASKKHVRFVKASHLLTALWEVIGLDRVARIETRKT